jgi:hypothetical protein
MQTKNRVLEIMKEERMDVTNKLLVINCQIIYTTAQRDLLIEQRGATKSGN